jgi:WD40 repeat protein/serine/threonine protein kinase
MVRVCRCRCGHTWVPAPGTDTARCPVCGNTTPIASDLTDPHLPTVRPPDPSFSSLVGLPAVPPDPNGPTLSPDRPVTGRADDAAQESPTLEFVPPLVPGYEIVCEVGRGGMGVVYKARQVSLNRPVALKMILSGPHAGAAERDRLKREAEAVAALQHPHIVQIFEVGEANGHPYLALEFVDGGSLADHLAGQPWPARPAAELVELLARAVHYAHARGVVHRDLKPGNVLLGYDERGTTNDESRTTPGTGSGSSFIVHRSTLLPKITDFGLAKRLDGPDGVTKTGAVMGTPSYIAPEQASGKVREVGPPADVYALGAILYELLTGRPPFRGETSLDTVLQVMHDDPVPPKRLRSSVPSDLETVCLKCLNKNPARRYDSALALADDLRRFLGGEPILARPLSAWGRVAKWSTRHPALTVFGGAAVVATVGLVVVLSLAYARVAEAKAQKEAEAGAARLARADAEKFAAETLDAKNHAVGQQKLAEGLAADNLRAKLKADEQARAIRAEAERTKRAAYALQLNQIAALCERDPKRAEDLLNDPIRCPPELRDFTWAYLYRLCHREDRAYRGHPAGQALHAVASAPGGGLVASSGDDGTVRLWEPRNGRTWAVLAGHTGPVLAVAFSPDNSVLATVGADRCIRLWELPLDVLAVARRAVSIAPFIDQAVLPARLIPEIVLGGAHPGRITCVAFSPDGRTLVTGGTDGDIRWWDLTRWRPAPADVAGVGGPAAAGAGRVLKGGRLVRMIRNTPAHRDGVRGLCFSPDGARLASAGNDRTVRVWTGDGGRMIGWFPNFPEPVPAVAFSPDGRLLALAENSKKGHVVRVIDPATGQSVYRLAAHTERVTSLGFSPDGQLLVSGSDDGTVRVWDVEDGRERGRLRGHTAGVNAVAFGPDRRSVVSAGADGTARVWLTGVRANESADVARSQVAAAAVGASGHTLVVAGEGTFGSVRVLMTDPVAVVPKAPGRMPVAGTLPLWDVPLQAPFREPVRAAAVAPAADGQAVYLALDDRVFRWKILRVGGRPLPIARPASWHLTKPPHALAVSPTGDAVATLDADGVSLWDMTVFGPTAHPTAPPSAKLVLSAPDAREAVFLPGGRLVVAVGTGVKVIDRDGRELAADPHAHKDSIRAVAFDTKNGLLATGDAEGRVRVWTIADGKLHLVSQTAEHTDAVQCLAFSADGRTLASGSADRTVILWDPQTGHERGVLTGHADRVLAVRFAADGSALLTISRDGVVKRWRANRTRKA